MNEAIRRPASRAWSRGRWRSSVRTKLPPNGRAVSAAVSRTTAPVSADQVSVTMPSAPAFETAAPRRGTATMGARTIGRSIPSNSLTAVLMTHGVPAAPARDTNQDQPALSATTGAAERVLPRAVVATARRAIGPAGATATDVLMFIRGRRRLRGTPVPSVKFRVVAGVPGLAQSRGAEVPVRTDLGGDRAQVAP